MSSNAYQRAEMPSGATAVLDQRTLRNSIPHLRFDCTDILDDATEDRYAVITIARTLQWIADPG